MYVIPAEGLTVPDPVLRDHLPPHGRDVAPSEFWTRRLADGDVLSDADTIGKALASAGKARDAAKAARDAADAKRKGLADGADGIPAADEALAGAEAALRAAEAIVADITPHAPRHAPRAAGGKE